MNPVEALMESIIRNARERADCYKAGRCVHGHINGACDFAPEGDA